MSKEQNSFNMNSTEAQLKRCASIKCKPQATNAVSSLVNLGILQYMLLKAGTQLLAIFFRFFFDEHICLLHGTPL